MWSDVVVYGDEHTSLQLKKKVSFRNKKVMGGGGVGNNVAAS